MDRMRALKTLVYMIAAILVLQLGILIWIVRPASFYEWTGFAVITVLCLYLVRLSLQLISELEDKNKNI